MVGWSSQSVSHLVSQFSLKLTRDREPYHTPGMGRLDMPCCVLCRVCCVVFVPVVSLRSVFEVTRLESTQRCHPRSNVAHPPSHPGLTNMPAWLSPSSHLIPGGSLAQHRPDRPDGILVASRLSPRRTQSKIRALLCSLGRLTTLVLLLPSRRYGYIVPQQRRCRSSSTGYRATGGHLVVHVVHALSPGTRRDGSGLVWSDVPRAPTSIIPCHSHSHTQTLPDKLFCLPSRSLARPLIGGMGPLSVSSLLGGNLSLQLETWAYL